PVAGGGDTAAGAEDLRGGGEIARERAGVLRQVNGGEAVALPAFAGGADGGGEERGQRQRAPGAAYLLQSGDDSGDADTWRAAPVDGAGNRVHAVRAGRRGEHDGRCGGGRLRVEVDRYNAFFVRRIQ